MLCGQGVGAAAKGIYTTVTATADDLYEDILPAVEATVDALDNFYSAMTNITLMAIHVTALLRQCELSEPIDPSGIMVEGLERAENDIRGGIDILRTKRSSAERDSQLQGDNEHRVINAYDRAIVALGGLHDASVDFRWAMMERDATLEVADPTISTSVSDLAKRLQA